MDSLTTRYQQDDTRYIANAHQLEYLFAEIPDMVVGPGYVIPHLGCELDLKGH